MKENIRDNIIDLERQIRKIVYLKDVNLALVRLVFIKYCIDNTIGAENREDFQSCVALQNAFLQRDLEGSLKYITRILAYIDDFFELDDILLARENVDAYCNDLGINFDSWRTDNRDSEVMLLFDMLTRCDFHEPYGGKAEVGEKIVSVLLQIFKGRFRKSSFGAEFSTDFEVALLVKGILNVRENEEFCDFVSGIGTSTVLITKAAKPKLVNVEIYPIAAAISAMLYIMCGYENFKIKCGDSLSNIFSLPRVDKIFADIPYRAKRELGGENGRKDACSIAVEIVEGKILNAGGLAVLTVPGSTLYQSGVIAKEAKTSLVQRGAIKAVIALSPMWQNLNVGTNLLVISPERNESVLFIDATTEDFLPDKTGSSNGPDCFETLRKRILEIMRNPRDEEGFSKIVSPRAIAEKDYNLVPAQYIRRIAKSEGMSLREIDEKLEILYGKLLAERSL